MRELHPRPAPRSLKLVMPYGTTCFPGWGCATLRNLRAPVERGAGSSWRLVQISCQRKHAGLCSHQGSLSSLPLLQLIQAAGHSFWQRLRGKHGFTPGIQRLSFRDDLLVWQPARQLPSRADICTATSKSGTSSGRPAPALRMPADILCYNPHSAIVKRLTHAPIVMDMERGQQVRFQESPSSNATRPSQGHMHPASVQFGSRDNSDRVLAFICPMETCRACIALHRRCS